ncbi:MAG: hypothetical protein WBE68_05905 [Candidatus Nitrosopolaris sp.]
MNYRMFKKFVSKEDVGIRMKCGQARHWGNIITAGKEQVNDWEGLIRIPNRNHSRGDKTKS